MDEHLSEIIKDLSEAFLAIVSSICLIITTIITARKKIQEVQIQISKKGKMRETSSPYFNYNITCSSIIINENLRYYCMRIILSCYY